MTFQSATTVTGQYSESAIPACAGIGLRGPHMVELQETVTDVGWLEVHSENYFGDGGAPIHHLMNIRKEYPISLHGVGLSLGSSDPLNKEHLNRLQRLIDQVEPGLVSEHLSWGSIDGIYFNDLLPLPYTEEALNHFSERVIQVQDHLRSRILIENPSSYLCYRHSVIPEWEFLTEISRRTGAGLLLDVNNVFVSAVNLNFDPQLLVGISPERILQFHFALASDSRLVHSPFPIFQIWCANQPDYAGDQQVDLAKGGESVLVTRPGLAVELHKLDPVDARLLQSLTDGHNLNKALELALKDSHDFDLQTTLARYLLSGVLVPDMEISSKPIHSHNHPGGK